MATKLPPVKGAQYVFSTVLFSQSDDQIQETPTLATGDVKVSKDSGALANIATLPSETPASSGVVQVTLSAAEMTADEIVVLFKDAAGDEWHNQSIVIHTIAAGQQFDDLSTLAQADILDDATPFSGADIAAILADTGTDIPALIAALNDLSAAEVNAEVDTALTDYDAPTKAELDSGLAALNDVSVADILAGAVEGSITIQQALRLLLSFVAGTTTGGNTTSITFKSQDGNTNRIVMTVDSDGDRSAVVVDGS